MCAAPLPSRQLEADFRRVGYPSRFTRVGYRLRLRTYYRSQNVTVAAMQMAEKKVGAPLS